MYVRGGVVLLALLHFFTALVRVHVRMHLSRVMVLVCLVADHLLLEQHFACTACGGSLSRRRRKLGCLRSGAACV